MKLFKIKHNILLIFIVAIIVLILLYQLINVVNNSDVKDLSTLYKITNNEVIQYIHDFNESELCHESELPIGMIRNAIYNSSNELINSGKTVKIEDGTFEGYVYFEQNLPYEQNYILIVLVDFVQQSFLVDDIAFYKYRFILADNECIELPIKIDGFTEYSHELSYLIIPEPDLSDLVQDNMAPMMITDNIAYTRIIIDGLSPEKESIKFVDNYFEFEHEGNCSVLLSADIDDIRLMPFRKSQENIKLIIGNGTEQYKKYVMVAFFDWNQIPIFDSNIFETVNVPSKSNIYFDINAPITKDSKPYQIFLFPDLYDLEISKRIDPVKCTLRTIIIPNK